MAKPSRPVPPHVWAQRITDLLRLGRFVESHAAGESALAEHPADLRVLHAAALASRGMRRFSEAAERWRAVLQQERHHPDAAIGLASVLEETGRPDEALDWTTLALRLAPRRVDAWLLHVKVLRHLGRMSDALGSLRAALQQMPAEPELLWYSCVLTAEAGHHDQAAVRAEQILAQDPHHAGALAVRAEALARSSRWDELAAARSRLVAAASAAGQFASAMDIALSCDDPALLHRALLATGPQLPRTSPRCPAAPARERLTIAYCSPDLREHPVARMLLPVLQAHDRSRFRILTAGLRTPDPGFGNTVMRAADAHIDLCRSDDASAAAKLREAEVDVVVDLAGATTFNRYGIYARRPAPVQVLWLGCPTGTGADWYDALLVDAHAAPSGIDGCFREPLVRLPLCYHPITSGGSEPDPACTRAEAGLPADAVVLACPHGPNKVGPPLVDLWLRLAVADPRVVLWLDARDEAARARIRAYALQRGVPASRLAFWAFQADRRRYLGMLRLAHLFLDNHPYGAHSTAGEALAVGVPVLTPGGAGVAARVAGSMLHTIGLGELACAGLDDYERRIRDLVADDQARRALRQRVEAIAREVIPGTVPALVRELELAYQRLVEAARAQACPPAPSTVATT